MNFQRTIQNLYENEPIDINTFLQVTWYGRSSYEGVGSKLKIWKEVILANIDLAKYDNSLWQDSAVFKVYILETEIVSTPLGSIYNSMGKLVLNPLKKSKKNYGLYTPKLKLHKDVQILRTGFYTLLKNSIYPYYEAVNNTEQDRVYNKAPYYIFCKGMTDYILPIHVVNSFFYYKNSRCVHHITLNEVVNMFEKPHYSDNIAIVPYHGQFVELDNASFFSKFLFLNNTDGINCLKKIPIELLADSKNLTPNKRAYMLGGFPIDTEGDIQVIGQYITNNREGGRNKFLVYGITEFKPNEPVFNINEYKLLNLEDKRSTDSDRPDYEKSFTAILPKEVRGGKHDYGSPTNSSVPIKKDSIESSFFEESPLVEIIVKEVQLDFYKKESTVIQEIEGYSKNYNDTDYKSKIGSSSTEILIESNEYFRLFRDVITEIEKVQNYTTDIFEIKTDYIFGKNTIVLCASITYKGYHYYLLDYGFGTGIPIFRYTDPTLSMRYNEVEDLIIKIYSQELTWFNILNEQKANKRYLLEGICILAIRNHPSKIKDYEQGVKSLKSRICNNIFEDRNSKKQNT